MSSHNVIWHLSKTITSQEKLFSCPSSVAISHRHSKLFVATYDDIECWALNTCIQVFNISTTTTTNNDNNQTPTTTTTYSYQGRMLLPANARNLLCVNGNGDDDLDDDSLLVTCQATNALYRFQVSDLLENAFDDDNYETAPVWKIGGRDDPLFGFASGMAVANLEESGEKIIFICDGKKNSLVIVSFKDGSVLRCLQGQPKREETEEETQENQEIPVEEKDETRYSFKSIDSVAVKQLGNEYTIIVSGYNTNYIIVLKGLMSTEVIETKLNDEWGTCCAIDNSNNQILFANSQNNDFSIVDLESLKLIGTAATTQYNLQRPGHVYLDDSTDRTLYIVNDDGPSISILKESSL